MVWFSKVFIMSYKGGTMDINIKDRWTQNMDTIFKYAKEQNDKGNVFPMIGQCLGLHLFGYLTS